MTLDLTKTIAVFAAVQVFAVSALYILPEVTPMAPMTTQTIMMMVLPSMLIFGGIMLAIGVKHGEYRATA